MNRHAAPIRWLSALAIVVSVALILRRLPTGPVINALTAWIERLGFWGPLAFGLVYVLAVVAVFPCSALTLMAGAVFGLVVGMVTVSIASTTGAALAFLLARYAARDAIASWMRRQPKFTAVDRAIGENGWKIVAMLRLSPAVPFNIQNYLYGLTAIRFWPYVLTSWIAMMPGTFLYLYVGHLGRLGLEAASVDRPARSPADWAMLGVGLVASVGVTVYIARLARSALATQIPVDQSSDAAVVKEPSETFPATGAPLRTVILATIAVVLVTAAALIYLKPETAAVVVRPLR